MSLIAAADWAGSSPWSRSASQVLRSTRARARARFCGVEGPERGVDERAQRRLELIAVLADGAGERRPRGGSHAAPGRRARRLRTPRARAARCARPAPWRSMRRRGEPEDVVAAVTFLASERAGFITWQTLSVSGGLTMV